MRAIAAALALLVLCGCLHITEEQDCLALHDESRDRCHHEVAVGYVLRGDVDSAVEACNRIEAEEVPGVPADTSAESIAKGMVFGKGQHDACIMDVAEMARDPDICRNIEPGQNPLAGDVDPMENLCRDNAARPAEFQCFSTLFILAALSGAFALRL